MLRSKAIIAAAATFKATWDRAMAHGNEGLILGDLDIVEVHEAALGLIAATGATDLQSALEVLRDFDGS